jgi:hypothetical protein
MSTKTPAQAAAEGPYTTILASDFHKEAGFFGVYVIRDGQRVAERLGPLNGIEADVIRDEMNAAYFAGQASQQPQIPGEPTAGEYYVAVLVNALRLHDADKTRLVKDLCERGASQAPSPTIEQVMEVVERWRWKPGTTSLTAMEDLRDRLSKLLPQ